MQEHHLTVSRTARYFTLGAAGPATRQVWFVCHGYGQLAGRFLRHFARLDDGRRLVVAPEGLSRFYVDPHRHEKVGATWMTREDRLSEINDYVQYLDALYAEIFRRMDRATVAVFVLGFSQGGATAARWIAMGSARADHLILWGELVPPDLDLAAAKSTLMKLRLSLVCGRQDQFVTAEKLAQAEERLRAHGIPYQLITYDGGHELDDEVLRQLAEP